MREYFAFTSWMGILFGSVTATTGLATFVLSDALPGDPFSRGIGAVVLVTALVTPIALAGYRRLARIIQEGSGFGREARASAC